MVAIEDAAGKFTRGFQELQAGNHEQAVEAFSEAIAAFPQFEPAFRLRSEAYRALGLDQAANADLEQVISITRARLQEAERSLGGPAPQQADSKPAASSPGFLSTVIGGMASVATQSPLVFWTLIGSLVLIFGALAFILVVGGSSSS